MAFENLVKDARKDILNQFVLLETVKENVKADTPDCFSFRKSAYF